MDLSSGFPLSLAQHGVLCDYPRLDQDTRADVVVMGGGISGALVAYQLLQAGIDTIVVDGRTIGLGSTCASTSLLQYEIDVSLTRLQAMIGAAAAARAYRLCADAVVELAHIARSIGYSGLHSARSIHFAAAAKDIAFLEQELKARRDIGLSVEWLDKTALLGNYGIDAPAALCSEPAAQTDAYAFTHAIHQHTIHRGVRVYDRTTIKTVAKQKRGYLLVTDAGYNIRCRKLVYATGYEAARYLQRRVAQLSSTYAVASERMDENALKPLKELVIWGTGNPYLYLRTTADNRLIVGGRDEPVYSAAARDRLIKSKKRSLVKDVQRLLPGLVFRDEFSWAGTFGYTKDGLPFVGADPGSPDGFFALGFGGNGITFSSVAAHIITDMVLRRRNKDAMLFSLNRF